MAGCLSGLSGNRLGQHLLAMPARHGPRLELKEAPRCFPSRSIRDRMPASTRANAAFGTRLAFNHKTTSGWRCRTCGKRRGGRPLLRRPAPAGARRTGPRLHRGSPPAPPAARLASPSAAPGARWAPGRRCCTIGRCSCRLTPPQGTGKRLRPPDVPWLAFNPHPFQSSEKRAGKLPFGTAPRPREPVRRLQRWLTGSHLRQGRPALRQRPAGSKYLISEPGICPITGFAGRACFDALPIAAAT